MDVCREYLAKVLENAFVPKALESDLFLELKHKQEERDRWDEHWRLQEKMRREAYDRRR